MLIKLLKYEFKATSRMLLPIYAAIIAVAFINRIFMGMDVNGWMATPQFISISTYVLLIISSFVITFIIMIQRFYKNLLGDEGYLMLTIPVSAWKNVVSKLFTSAIWTILSVVIAFISVLILMDSEGLNTVRNEMGLIWSQGQVFFGSSFALLVTEIILYAIVSLLSSILLIYASISLGQLFSGHRVIGADLSYIGIYIVTQTILSIVIGIVATASGSLDMEITTYGLTLTAISVFLILNVIFAAAYFAITQIFLTKKLNLQ
jgi:hypothetical protein